MMEIHVLADSDDALEVSSESGDSRVSEKHAGIYVFFRVTDARECASPYTCTRVFFSYGCSVSTRGIPLSAEFQSLQMFKVGKALVLCTKQD